MTALHLKHAMSDTTNSLLPSHRWYFATGVLAALVAGFGMYHWLGVRFPDLLVAAAVSTAITMLIATGILLMISHYVAVVRLREMQTENAYLLRRESALFTESNYDGLTGLPNRRLIEDRFRAAAHRAQRSRTSFGFYRVHLPKFDRLAPQAFNAADDGHLVALADRLVQAVRCSDTVIRVGRGEFVLIVESIGNPHDLAMVSQKLLQAIRVGTGTDHAEYSCDRPTLGLALFPIHGDEVAKMMATAKQSVVHRHNITQPLADLDTFERGEIWASRQHM